MNLIGNLLNQSHIAGKIMIPNNQRTAAAQLTTRLHRRGMTDGNRVEVFNP